MPKSLKGTLEHYSNHVAWPYPSFIHHTSPASIQDTNRLKTGNILQFWAFHIRVQTVQTHSQMQLITIIHSKQPNQTQWITEQCDVERTAGRLLRTAEDTRQHTGLSAQHLSVLKHD